MEENINKKYFTTTNKMEMIKYLQIDTKTVRRKKLTSIFFSNQ